MLQHTDELIEQNRATIGRVAGLSASVVKAERDDWSGQVVFGSVQTLARSARRARMGQVSHLVIDECHRAAADSYQAIIADARAANPKVKLLGLSATPERGDGDADPALDFGLSKYAANCRLNFLWHRPQILAAVFPGGLGRAA